MTEQSLSVLRQQAAPRAALWYAVACLLIATAMVALWPAELAPGTALWTLRFAPFAGTPINPKVGLNLMVLLAGMLGSALRAVLNTVRKRGLFATLEVSIGTMEIVMSGVLALLAWTIIQSLLLKPTSNLTFDPGGAVGLAFMLGIWAPDLFNTVLATPAPPPSVDDLWSSIPGPLPRPAAEARRETPAGIPPPSAPVEEKDSAGESAESVLRLAVTRNPRDLKSGRELVGLLRRFGRLDEAVQVYDLLANADPDNDMLVSEQADVYREMGDNRRFIEAITAAEEIRGRRAADAVVNMAITLTEIEVRDLPFFGNFTWPLQPGVNVLLGRNGYGKSHLLRAMAAMLQADRKATQQFFPARPVANSRPMLRVAMERDGRPAATVRSLRVFDELAGRCPLLAIPDVRYIEKSDDSFGPVTAVSDLRMQGADQFIHERSFQSTILTFLYELYRDYNRTHSFDQPIFKLIEQSVQDLTDHTFKFHSMEDLDNARFRFFVLTEGNTSNPLPLQKASQGTLSVLSIVGLIYRFLKALHPDVADDRVQQQRGIVIIDEVDAHLHPTWQQQIMQLLCERFPNVQFIITAHTPLVVAGRRKREVSVLEKTPAGFTVVVQPGHFIGASAVSLYNAVFDVKNEDATYLELNTLQARRPELEKEIAGLRNRGENLTDEDHSALDKLEDQLFYLDEVDAINEVRERSEKAERDRQRLELENKNLKGEVSELKTQVQESAEKTTTES